MANNFEIGVQLALANNAILDLQKKLENQKANINAELIINQKQLDLITEKLKNIKITPTVDSSGLENIQTTITRAMDKPIKFNVAINQQSLQNVENKLKQIEEETGSLANVKITTDAFDNIIKAVLKYTNDVGQAATETMAWKTSIDTLDGVLTKTKNFETVKVDYTDNIAQTNKFADNLKKVALMQENLNTQILNMSTKKYSDESGIDKLWESVNNVDLKSKDAITTLKMLEQETKQMQNIQNKTISNYDKGDIVLLGQKIKLQEQLSASTMKNYTMEQEADEKLRQIESNKIKNRMQDIAQTEKQTQAIQYQINTISNSMSKLGDSGLIDSNIESFKTKLKEVQDIVNNIKMGNITFAESGIENTIRDLKEEQTALKNVNDLKKQSQTLQNALNETFNNIAPKQRTAELTAQYEKLKIAIKNATTASEFGQAKIALDEFVKSTNTAVDSTGKLGSSIKNLILQFTGLYAVMQAGRAEIDYISKLNKTQTEIGMVTGENSQQVQELTKSYASLADQVSSTTTDVANSGITWLRQGRSITDTNQLIKTSQVMSKVGMMDSADAAKSLTAAINAYHLEAGQAIDVVDKMSAIDANAAVTTQQLATSLSLTASQAQVAGISMDKLLGISATVMATTQQSAESVGNSIKTIMARMEQVKAGKLIDKSTGEDVNLASFVA